MLNDLIDKRKTILAESEQHKERRNELNATASKFARERNALNGKTREFVEEAQKNKELRDQANKDVQAQKEERNTLNEQANVLFEEIEVFKKEHGSLKNRGIKELQKQIENMEFRQQTEVFSVDKERELIEKIKALRTEIRDQEAELEQNKEMRTKLTDARELRRQASEVHARVTELAELAQRHHDLMVENYRSADKSREAADDAHKQFVEAQEAADAEHKSFLGCQKETPRLRQGDRRSQKEDPCDQGHQGAEGGPAGGRADLHPVPERERLTTDDLLLLQRSKMV